ncbi:MAG: hypothetical protein A2902_03375 [Elusimicrobia bacterium RIFCSPLOWO2_01_FULL_64_13]|nr:MAG: hypothetical protein A2902_03375 [Elusimicrobia bacterium RIFCSPLOWO2_01_FULL_64_13]
MDPRLQAYFERWRGEVDRALGRFLPAESAPPRTLHKAMRYSVFAGGKRLRPVLAIASAEACGRPGGKVLAAACALELIHTYSLIHDDLPAMDDDDLRRGRPTSHKVFGEAAAILAGDGLLTLAFNLLAKNGNMNDSSAVRTVEIISSGAGSAGMVGGQARDIEMEDGAWTKLPRPRRIRVLRSIHEKKTAALIEASVLAGAAAAGAPAGKMKRLSDYGRKIGLAFQIADDILDVAGNKALLGKKGSDRSNRKLTYPAIFGLETSRKKARDLVRGAKRALAPFGKRGWVLDRLADYIVERTY